MPQSNHAAAHDILAVGLMAVDVLIRLPHVVVHGDKQFVDDLIIQGGAPVGTGIAAASRLGLDAAVVAKLGDNTLSEIAREQFRASGVGLDLLIHDPDARPAVALVQIDPVDAARTVFIQMDHYGYVRPDELPADAIRASRCILVDSYDLDATEAALRIAADSPCQTVLDFESGDAGRMRGLLELGDHAILPLASASHLAGVSKPGDALQALSKHTPGNLLTTDGTDGSWALIDGSIHHQPAFNVKAIDTTGCGDAYHAGYIVGLHHGLSIQHRMELGAWLAAIVATRVGGRTALPRVGKLGQHLRKDLSPELTAFIKEHDL
ncbi:MAG: carbohydrate kinase family protein [Planctomycetota bacterium]